MRKSVLINLSIFLISVVSGAPAESFSQDVIPFPPHDVRLELASLGARAMALNKDYMLSLDVDSLLLTFRRNAGLPAPGDPFAGSWEDPACEVRGQFMGHYLSATARLQGMKLGWETQTQTQCTAQQHTLHYFFNPCCR